AALYPWYEQMFKVESSHSLLLANVKCDGTSIVTARVFSLREAKSSRNSPTRVVSVTLMSSLALGAILESLSKNKFGESFIANRKSSGVCSDQFLVNLETNPLLLLETL